MKIVIKKALLSLPGILFAVNILSAQEVLVPTDKPKIARENISKEQVAMLKANGSKQIEFRNAFRETLSGNQLESRL